MPVASIAVIGAGPYGLTAAAHLRAAGADVRVFGEVMSFWQSMPPGMLLRSSRGALSLTDLARLLTLDDFERAERVELTSPIARSDFLHYGEWFQCNAVPEIEPSMVARIERRARRFDLKLTGGEVFPADRVVIATGLTPFMWRLPMLTDLPCDRVSHSLQQRDPAAMTGKRVLVVGSGQSAIENAIAMRECGAG